MCYIDLLISDQWKLLRFDLFEGFSRESECFFQGHVARLCEVLTGKDANVQAVKSESSARRNISTDSPNIYASRFKYIFFYPEKKSSCIICLSFIKQSWWYPETALGIFK